MSAWLVSKTHIDALVTAAVGWEVILPDQVEDTGKMLWIQNIISLEYRYPHHVEDNEQARRDAGKYVFERLEGRIDPYVVERSISCYNYQSCEDGGWKESEACRLMGRLESIAEDRSAEYTQRFGSLTREDWFLWGIDHRDVLLEAEQRRAAKVSA